MTFRDISKIAGLLSGKHYSYRDLADFLNTKHALASKKVSEHKKHLDSCGVCWEIWNRVRWDAAWTKKGVQELAEFLGAEFEKYFDSSWALAYEWYAKNPKEKGDIEGFYHTTKYFMYNSVVFYESGDRLRFDMYFDFIWKNFHPKTVLDYGCGVGNDGLDMMKRGADVYFADLKSPTTDFLLWRLKKRGKKVVKNTFTDVSSGVGYPEVEMIWLIDVLEHMVDPKESLRTISPKTKLFVYFTDTDDKAGGRHPFHIHFSDQKISDELIRLGFGKISYEGITIWSRK